MELLFVESSTRGWGTEQHSAALAIAMARRNHHVRCIIPVGTPLETVLREAGVPVVLNERPVRGSVDTRAMRTLYRVASQRRTDWLITNEPKLYWPLVLIGRLTGTRTALFRHWENMNKGALTRRFIPRLADRFVLVSRAQREHLRADGVDVTNMSILYNPIDTQRLSPSDEARARGRASLGVMDGQIVVGYVGRMVRDKGIFTLLKASEQFLPAAPETRLVWVGEGLDLPELRARVEQSVCRERHIFRRWSADIQAIYTALDVLVVPSEYAEPFGRVSVEAQACGTPVICSDAGGLPETLTPQITGLLTRKGDSEQLAAAVLELARDPDRRRSVALAGRRLACASFSMEHIANEFEALLANGPRSYPVAGGETAR